jgi:hypothetical protein
VDSQANITETDAPGSFPRAGQARHDETKREDMTLKKTAPTQSRGWSIGWQAASHPNGYDQLHERGAVDYFQ